MIFCFSGTGNSLYVTEQIEKTSGDNIVMMTENERKLHKTYEIKENETLGFVFPIHWWGVPAMVEDFVRDMKIEVPKETYIYAVATFGLMSGNGLYDLRRLLSEKNVVLSANYEVKMVDNYVVGYELAKEEKRKEILAQADIVIKSIVEQIMERQKNVIHDGIFLPLKPLVHQQYKCTSHQKKFYATDSCVGCGLCEKNCPSNAIVMENNKPQWTKNCSFCLKCINSCPREAVQYGKGTEHRNRYYNAQQRA